MSDRLLLEPGPVIAGEGYEGPVVYVLQAGAWGPVKIGSSTTRGLRSRISSIQTGNPERVKLLRTYIGGRELERKLHERFRDCRMAGEWFALTDELRDLVCDQPNFPERVFIRGKLVSEKGRAV
jgi:hypothetical protein